MERDHTLTNQKFQVGTKILFAGKVATIQAIAKTYVLLLTVEGALIEVAPDVIQPLSR